MSEEKEMLMKKRNKDNYSFNILRTLNVYTIMHRYIYIYIFMYIYYIRKLTLIRSHNYIEHQQ